jgi:hypothetical protein
MFLYGYEEPLVLVLNTKLEWFGFQFSTNKWNWESGFGFGYQFCFVLFCFVLFFCFVDSSSVLNQTWFCCGFA